MNPSTSVSDSTTANSNRWRTARRLLLGLAGLATLIALFYTEENWRGQRAWADCRRALEAQGEVLDWTAYVPPPVPDDENFYKAPKMQEWFVKEHFAIGGSDAAKGEQPFVPRSGSPQPKETDLVLAEVNLVAPGAPLDVKADAVLRLDDPSALEQTAKLLQTKVGPLLSAAKGGVFLARSPGQSQPLHLVIEGDPAPGAKALTDFFRSLLRSHSPGVENSLQVNTRVGHVLRVWLKAPVYGAAEYLAWTDSLAPDFDRVRQALERPYARIDSDYQQPYGIAIPNFVRMRNVVQTLAQRAQCDLLLRQPEAAWRELGLIHDFSHILLAKPSGKPLTLVGAMINVAINGLYAAIVENGLQLHAWREPQLVAIQKQLQATELLPAVVEAFHEERAGTSRTFEITPRRELLKLFAVESRLSKVGLAFMPRGWFYQNMAAGAELYQTMLGGVDLTNRVVQPTAITEVFRRMVTGSWRSSPYTFLVALAIPNFTKALQTAALNQTQLNQADVACSLERYRLSHGQYPGSLDVLSPQFIDKPPHDLIGGQGLKYRPTDGGGYVLYSIGWDGKDDGGVPGQTREEGDWVWELR